KLAKPSAAASSSATAQVMTTFVRVVIELSFHDLLRSAAESRSNGMGVVATTTSTDPSPRKRGFPVATALRSAQGTAGTPCIATPSRAAGPCPGRLAVHRRAARRAHPLEIRAEKTAETVVDRHEQAAGDEDPRLRDRIALLAHRSRLLCLLDHAGEEGVDLADLPAYRLCDRRGVRRPLPRPDPPGGPADAGTARHVRVADHAETAARVVCERLLGRCPEARPRLVEAREVEVALRAEVPVEDRLGDPRLARDLGRRRAAVR